MDAMSDYEMIGKTVVEYTDNSRHIACLKKQLADIGDQLVLLGNKLKDAPMSVTVAPNAIQVTLADRFTAEDHVQAIPLTTLDHAKLQHILSLLTEAQGSRQELDQTLTGMRLPELIRDA